MSKASNKKEVAYLSPNQKAMRRLLRNKAALLGLSIIGIAILIALFAYAIVPDSTPNANEQILEIATEEPGFEMDMLKVRKNHDVPRANFISFLMSGRENPHKLYPIIEGSQKFIEDKIVVDLYSGKNESGEKDTFNLADVVYDLSNELSGGKGVNRVGEELSFVSLSKGPIKANIKSLQAKVEAEHIDRKKYLLGTDKFGRDNLSRLILGVRVSLSVGLVAVLISLLIGIPMGALAGFYRKTPPKTSIWDVPAFLIALVLGGFIILNVAKLLFSLTSMIVFQVFIILLTFPGFMLLVAGIFLALSKLFGLSIGKVFDREFNLPVDDIIMYIINVFWSIPLLLWVFALVLALGREFWQIFLAVGLVMWVEIARVLRGQIFSIREKEFVEAAQTMAFNDFRIIFKHVLPNALGPIIVITAANFASAIIIEAGLSFLGIGVQPPQPSWGTTLNDYYKYIGTNKSFLAILPGIAILVLTLGFNLVGNGIRDALDVKTKL